jgi:hypothetical protein
MKIFSLHQITEMSLAAALHLADLEKAKGKCPCGEALSEPLPYLVKWWPRQAPVSAEIEKNQSGSLCPFSFQRKAESRKKLPKW